MGGLTLRDSRPEAFSPGSQRLQCASQGRSSSSQFGEMMHDELPQDLLAARGQLHQDAAAIAVVPDPLDKTVSDQPIDQANGAVMTDL